VIHHGDGLTVVNVEWRPAQRSRAEITPAVAVADR
jgi:hypothetical protein